jgi:hypothetical protein
MKLKKEMRAVKEINEQARRDREEHSSESKHKSSGDSEKNRNRERERERERSERDRDRVIQHHENGSGESKTQQQQGKNNSTKSHHHHQQHPAVGGPAMMDGSLLHENGKGLGLGGLGFPSLGGMMGLPLMGNGNGDSKLLSGSSPASDTSSLLKDDRISPSDSPASK